jgi:hypothetical protein
VGRVLEELLSDALVEAGMGEEFKTMSSRLFHLLMYSSRFNLGLDGFYHIVCKVVGLISIVQLSIHAILEHSFIRCTPPCARHSSNALSDTRPSNTRSLYTDYISASQPCHTIIHQSRDSKARKPNTA